MSLLRLPPELLFEIIEWLGPPFFRYNLARLTLCKDWYYLARKVFLSHVTLSADSLERLLALPRSESFKQYLKTLSLEFSGYEELRTLRLKDRRLVTRENKHSKMGWTFFLNSYILELVTTLLRDCGALDTISLSALCEQEHFLTYGQRAYLHGWSLAGLLSLKSITVLELDTYGSPALSYDGPHICACIGAMIPQLRRLRVRMCEICPDVLRPGENSTDPLFLEEAIVNLSLPNMSRNTSPARYAKRCDSSVGQFGRLGLDIEEQAALLIQQMSCPRRVRILTHSFPSLKILSFDALTGKRMILDDDVSWGADGETDIECDPEPSFTI
ncbi:hypothetical protein FQN52_001392 [Onygenales sp. PD_12]|nr:hypothetical protein FQN52_001392 [Onygenales sp. PD_12]